MTSVKELENHAGRQQLAFALAEQVSRIGRRQVHCVLGEMQVGAAGGDETVFDADVSKSSSALFAEIEAIRNRVTGCRFRSDFAEI